MRQPRWYVDADTLGLAHLLAAARTDVTYCGDDGIRKKRRLNLPPCVIQDSDTDDDIWIPAVTDQGLTIITRDVHIEQRSSEIAAVIASSARMFAITTESEADGTPGGRRRLHNWDLLEIAVTRWRDMELAVRTRPGPFIYSLTRTGLRLVDLAPHKQEGGPVIRRRGRH